MKLFILAALIAVSSAARLEHLERGYLPPDQASQGQGFGSQGQGSFGGHSSHGSQSNGFGSHGSSGFGSQGSNGADSTGFGSSPVGSRTGPSAFHGGSNFNAATSNQYLPPDHGPSGSGFPRPGGSRSQDAFGASSNQNQFGSQPNSQYGTPQYQGSNGFGAQGSKGFGSQGSNGFGSQGSNGFGSQGSNGFGSQGSNGFGSQGSNSFGSQGSNGFGSQGSNAFGSNARSQQGSRFDASRQYLAPKASSSFDKIPQQSFDEETGYHY